MKEIGLRIMYITAIKFDFCQQHLFSASSTFWYRSIHGFRKLKKKTVGKDLKYKPTTFLLQGSTTKSHFSKKRDSYSWLLFSKIDLNNLSKHEIKKNKKKKQIKVTMFFCENINNCEGFSFGTEILNSFFTKILYICPYMKILCLIFLF